ncbi:hypothetical protein A7982_13251 [Minicystis rosea]|nr:hypothetical protein A7982_13251 [Minicystis rosea]
MFEIIIERPRLRVWGGSKGRLRELAGPRCDESPTRVPVRRTGKMLNENLAPLRRFLASRVGRPWNDVHREMSAFLCLQSAVQKHVLDHVREMVEEHAVIRDGIPHSPIARGSRRDKYQALDGTWRNAFYVCPRTGILRASHPSKFRREKRDNPDRKPIDASREACRFDGVWYLVTYAPLPETQAARQRVWDVVAKVSAEAAGILNRTHGRADRYAVAKRQLSTREIRDLVGGEPRRSGEK